MGENSLPSPRTTTLVSLWDPSIDQNPRDSRLSSVGIVGSVWKWLGVMERSVRPESGNLFTSTFRLGIAQQDNLRGDLDKAMGWIQGTFGNPSAEQFDKVRRNYVDAMETMLNHAQSEEASSTHNRSREKDKGAGESRRVVSLSSRFERSCVPIGKYEIYVYASKYSFFLDPSLTFARRQSSSSARDPLRNACSPSPFSSC